MAEQSVNPAAQAKLPQAKDVIEYHSALVEHVNSMIDYINEETKKHQELLKIVTNVKDQLVTFHTNLSATDVNQVHEVVKEAEKFAQLVKTDAKKAKGWFK